MSTPPPLLCRTDFCILVTEITQRFCTGTCKFEGEKNPKLQPPHPPLPTEKNMTNQVPLFTGSSGVRVANCSATILSITYYILGKSSKHTWTASFTQLGLLGAAEKMCLESHTFSTLALTESTALQQKTLQKEGDRRQSLPIPPLPPLLNF